MCTKAALLILESLKGQALFMPSKGSTICVPAAVPLSAAAAAAAAAIAVSYVVPLLLLVIVEVAVSLLVFALLSSLLVIS